MASDFGSGLGTIIGSSLASGDLTSGMNNVGNLDANFGGIVAPYNEFGASFTQPATNAINNIGSVAGTTEGYEDFLKNYSMSPGAKYQEGVADAAQNNSAAAKGDLLSGSNLRSLDTINQGIASTDASQSYQNYLAGNNQQFGQLEQSLGNMFQALGVGTTVTGQDAGVTSSTQNAQANIAQAQAKNDQSKGSGFGSLFSGIGSIAASF